MPATRLQPAASDRSAAAFVLRLARALHIYGTPTHRLEEALVALARRLGIDAQFLVTPTSIVASFGPPDDARTALLRVDQGEVDLEKLTELHELIRSASAGSLDLEEASRQADAIVDRPGRYGRAATLTAFVLVSAGAAVFFGGGLAELVVAAGLGGLIGLLAVACERLPRLALLLPAVAAILATGISYGIAPLLPPLVPFVPTLAGLVVLLPGLTLTTAVNELAHRHLVSGSARLVGALMTFLQIGFGFALGRQLAERWLGTVEIAAPAPLPVWILPPALVLTAVGLTLLFRARPRDFAVVLAAATVSLLGARLGVEALGAQLGVLAGSWLVGTAGILLSRWQDIPQATATLPGLLLLVPGSFGFRSLSALVERDIASGVEAFFTMMILAFALVVGLLLASLTSRPRNLLP